MNGFGGQWVELKMCTGWRHVYFWRGMKFIIDSYYSIRFTECLPATHGHLLMNTPEKSDQVATPPPYRYAGFTPAQKWQEVVKLRKMAWDLKTAMVKSNHPDWTEEQVKAAVKEIFLYATTRSVADLYRTA